MDDEQELLPDDLDALIDDLQKGSPITVPTSQQPAAEFLQDLVNSAHATELDPTYAARLDQRLKNNVTLIFPRGALQIWLASLHPGQPWRRLALALTSITLVSVLAISSMVSPRMPIGEPDARAGLCHPGQFRPQTLLRPIQHMRWRRYPLPVPK